MSEAPAVYISVRQLAQLAEIGFTSAKLAIRKGRKGESWRGVVLAIKSSHGRGGAGGRQSLIRLDSLPVDLQERARELLPVAQDHTPVPQSDNTLQPKRRPRRDIGKSRVAVTQKIDKVLRRHLSIDQVEAIANDLNQYAKGAWASELGRPGWRKVATATTLYLHGLCRDAGIPDDAIRQLDVTRHYVEDFDRSKHRKTDIALNDAKKFHDAIPPVQRDWSLLERPLDIVIGDGTALDVRVVRPDGGEWKVWLILWMDGLTGRLFGHPYARPRGGGVKQDHIAYSFACLASQIGMPKALMLDNGSEYGALDALGGVTRIVKSIPYAARSKPIEAAIRVLVHQHIALIPGYIGSDRMRKKSQSVGKPITPYPRSIHALFSEISTAIEHFNGTKRRRLDWRTSNEVWKTHLDSGWRPDRFSLESMLEGLAKIETRKVRQGRIEIGGRFFTSDELQDWGLEGERVTIALPRASDSAPSVYDPKGRFVSLIHEQQSYHPLDTDGAREASRQSALRRKSAKAMHDEASPVDLVPFQEAFRAEMTVPDDTLEGDYLEFSDERASASHSRRNPSKRRGKRKPTGLLDFVDEAQVRRAGPKPGN